MLPPAKAVGLRKVDDITLESGRLILKCLVGLLSEWEFWACFHILDNIPIHLIDNEALSSVDQPNNAMYFTKEQFVTGLCLPLPFLFKQFLHFTQIPPVFVHPNVV